MPESELPIPSPGDILNPRWLLSVDAKSANTYGVRNLRETFEFLRGNEILNPPESNVFEEDLPHYEVDFADVKGQHATKRAIEVGAAGGHNLLTLKPNLTTTADFACGGNGRHIGTRCFLH